MPYIAKAKLPSEIYSVPVTMHGAQGERRIQKVLTVGSGITEADRVADAKVTCLTAFDTDDFAANNIRLEPGEPTLMPSLKAGD